MQECATQISFNKQIVPGIYCLRFPVGWGEFDPGQFVMLSMPGDTVFLRRPFGIVRIEKKEAEICYKVVGKGTAALAKAPSGSKIDVLGPCGTGFNVRRKFKTAVLVAGGYGVAPLFGLARKIAESGKTVEFYYGCRDKKHLLYISELKKIGIRARIATEDGSAGERGLVTRPLAREISHIERPALFACGPSGLIETVAKIGMERNLPAQVSMETNMACGLGVCLGCVCKNANGEYVRVCREGPVFDVRQLWKPA